MFESIVVKGCGIQSLFFFFKVHTVDIDCAVICPRDTDAKLYGIYSDCS